MRRAATLLLLAGTGLAAAALTEIRWSADGRFEQRFELAPGGVAELCGPLAAGTRVRWSWAAPVPLDFNIHYHEGEKVVYPAQQAGQARAEGRLEVPAAQDYCWMWTHRGSAPTHLQVRLAR